MLVENDKWGTKEIFFSGCFPTKNQGYVSKIQKKKGFESYQKQTKENHGTERISFKKYLIHAFNGFLVGEKCMKW